MTTTTPPGRAPGPEPERLDFVWAGPEPGRPRTGHGTDPGPVAGGALAPPPAGALVFRLGHPRRLPHLAAVGARLRLVAGVERARPGWVLLGGAAVRFAFLAKMMQAFLPLPAFVLVYLL